MLPKPQWSGFRVQLPGRLLSDTRIDRNVLRRLLHRRQIPGATPVLPSRNDVLRV
jgi:hypothetical protein